jgi:uncharacterized protein
VLVFPVGDLIGHPGLQRRVEGSMPLRLALGESVVAGEAKVGADLEAIPDGILVRLKVRVPARHRCVRCLREWTGEVSGEAVELFARHPRGDQPGIAGDLSIDLGPWVRDEVSLGLPADPLCRPDCRGLCPTCGADLNMAPCGGHGEEPASPFAALKRLFEVET